MLKCKEYSCNRSRACLSGSGRGRASHVRGGGDTDPVCTRVRMVCSGGVASVDFGGGGPGDTLTRGQ